MSALESAGNDLIEIDDADNFIRHRFAGDEADVWSSKTTREPTIEARPSDQPFRLPIRPITWPQPPGPATSQDTNTREKTAPARSMTSLNCSRARGVNRTNRERRSVALGSSSMYPSAIALRRYFIAV